MLLAEYRRPCYSASARATFDRRMSKIANTNGYDIISARSGGNPEQDKIRRSLSPKVLPYKVETEKCEDCTSEEDVHVLCTAKEN